MTTTMTMTMTLASHRHPFLSVFFLLPPLVMAMVVVATVLTHHKAA